MMEPRVLGVFTDPDEIGAKKLAFEALQSVTRTVLAVVSTDAEVLAAYDDLAGRAKAADEPILNYAMAQRVSLSTPVAIMLLAGLLYRHGAQVPGQGAALIDSLWNVPPEERGTMQAVVLGRTLSLIQRLSNLIGGGRLSADVAGEIVRDLSRIAFTLQDEDREVAMACATSAGNFAMFDPTLAEAPARLSVTLLAEGDPPSMLVLTNAHLAHVLARIADRTPARRRDAYEAFERTLQLARMHHESLEPMTAMIDEWLATDYLRPLQLLFWSLSSPDQWRPLPANDLHLEEIAKVLDVMLNGDRHTFMNTVIALRDWAIAGENLLLRLDAPSDTQAAGVDWSTASLRHPALLRAVPHSTSILREANLDETLLLLDHELTHVRSLHSSIGVVLAALRSAICELESDLSAAMHSLDKGRDAAAFVRSHEPVTLFRAELSALAYAEAQVDLQLKIQAIEQLWEPWFEGLAVFGELAADPRLDRDAFSDVISVVFNLWDRYPAGLADERDKAALAALIEEHWQKEWANAERMYGEALDRRGRPRLRYYLGRDGYSRYLPGYLTIRSIVSGWRQRLDRRLTGTEAFASLLHVTRFTAVDDYIPDLSLPFEQFLVEARELLETWLMSVSRASATDLDTLAQSYQNDRKSGIGYRWEHGALQQVSEREDASRLFDQLTARLLASAYNTTLNARRDTPPIEGADEACMFVRMTMGNVLAERDRVLELGEFVMDTALSRLAILPLGRASCRFWLNRDGHWLACLVRTTESDKTHGDPGYDLVAFTLSPESFEALNQHVERRGDARLTVTRVADLLEESERGLGRNYLVFQLGDWLEIQPRGLAFGSTSVGEDVDESIRMRLMPNTGMDLFEHLAGADHPCAERTRLWLTEQSWSSIQTTYGADVRPWAKAVRDQAARVVAGTKTPEFRDPALYLRFVFGGDGDVAERLVTRGFTDLQDVDGRMLDQLIDLLYDSGRFPVDTIQDDLATTVSETVGPLLTRTSAGWDVKAPSSS